MENTLEEDKYHTFEITIYYELNKPKNWKKNTNGEKMGKKPKKTQECLNNIRICFPTYENECYAKRTRILHTMIASILSQSILPELNVIYFFILRKNRITI